MPKKMTWEEVVCELGENLGLSYGKVDELLSLMVFCLGKEYKYTKQQITGWLCNMATTDWQQVEKLFTAALEGQVELKAKKSQIEMERSTRALHNSLKGLLKFYQQHRKAV